MLAIILKTAGRGHTMRRAVINSAHLLEEEKEGAEKETKKKREMERGGKQEEEKELKRGGGREGERGRGQDLPFIRERSDCAQEVLGESI